MELLKRLSEAFGPSGYEDEIRDIVGFELKPMCDKVWTDTMGSVIGLKHGSAKESERKRIMVAGHIDEIGFRVTHVDKHGFLRVSPTGGFQPTDLVSQRVVVFGKGKTRLDGLFSIAFKNKSDAAQNRKDLQLTDFYVDLGMPPEKVKKLVEVGDPVIWNRSFIEMGDCYSGKAMDDRIGVYIMIEALRKTNGNRHDIYAVGTAQEEVGTRGAQTAAYEIDPHVAIAVDITGAIDIPGAEEHLHITKLGKGIALKIKDSHSISDPKLVKEFREIAEKHKIPYQIEILPAGGTDAGAMQRARGGASAITLSIPTRYGHSVNETVHKVDVEAGIDLLAKYLSR
jgi:putative aminopeptidase FrvX